MESAHFGEFISAVGNKVFKENTKNLKSLFQSSKETQGQKKHKYQFKPTPKTEPKIGKRNINFFSVNYNKGPFLIKQLRIKRG